MSRLSFPSSIASSPAASQASLGAIEKSLGVVPNLFRLVAQSPNALKGFLALSSSLSNSSLDASMQERIALTVAEANGCEYCLSAHTYLGRNVAKLDDAEMAANRKGSSHDPKADAALRFVATLVQARGHVPDAALVAIKAAGWSDAAIVEIVLAVALNTFTNYVNETAQTPIDFPIVALHRAAA